MAQSEELVQRLEDLRLGGHHELDVATEVAAEGVDGLEIERIGARHLETPVFASDRQHPVALGEWASGLRLDQVGVERQRVDAGVGQFRFGGDGATDVFLGQRGAGLEAGELESENEFVGQRPLLEGAARKTAAGHPGLAADVLGLGGGDRTLAHQDIGKLLGAQRHRPGV